MKIKFLGTGAGAGWPAVFCKCKFCENARKLKGKNLRSRTQTLINKDLLIDFPAESYYRAVHNDIDLACVEFLLVTHSHSDHFYPQEFVVRGGRYAHNLDPKVLHIYCNKFVKQMFDEYTSREIEPFIYDHIKLHVIKPFDSFNIGEYEVVALPAKHTKTEDDLIYLIKNDGKTLFYCNDTGRLTQNVYDYIYENNIFIDIINFDCTGGPMENGENSGHMGMADNLVVKNKLMSIGAINEKTICVMNHFSHTGEFLHDELEEIAKPHNFIVAYDFMEIDI